MNTHIPITTPPPTAGAGRSPHCADPNVSLIHHVANARTAQPAWAATPLPKRLRIIRRARQMIAESAWDLARSSAAARRRPIGEVLTSEVLPLIDACRFLERKATSILASRSCNRRGRPFWMWGHAALVERVPHGLVLIIGPGNYPLLLPAVQAIQALAAGNAVLLKPGKNGSAAAAHMRSLLVEAGLDEQLIHVLPEPPEIASAALNLGIDHVVFTGSAETGARILRRLAPRLIPATMELSGNDVVLVREDADLDLVVKAVVFGLQLNDGATCIAPRRLLVNRHRALELESGLQQAVSALPEIRFAGELNDRLLPLVLDAMADGGRLLAGRIDSDRNLTGPVVITGTGPFCRLHQTECFAPVLSIIPVHDDDEAVRLAAYSPYALGASVFSADTDQAHALAGRLHAGVVTINDLIVPTADPRLPFGGRRRSGFGVTRGPEGLLSMTLPKVITRRRGRRRPHYRPLSEPNALRLAGLIRLLHGKGWLRRVQSAFPLLIPILNKKNLLNPL